MLNHINVMGRLVRDPETRTTGSGINVTTFTVAVDRDRGAAGEREADFFDVAAWRQAGEFVSRYFHKGSMIVVSGRMQSRKWQDRDGNNRTSWEIVAEDTYFGESRRDSDTYQAGYQSSYQTQGGYQPQGNQQEQRAYREPQGGSQQCGDRMVLVTGPDMTQWEELPCDGEELPF